MEYGMWLQVASAGSHVYLAGNFTQIGHVAASNIARWGDTNWHPLGPGLPGTVTCLVATERYVYAAGGLPDGGVSRWDGTNWTVLGQYLSPVVLAAQGEDVYAADARSAGPFGPYIYKWTGSTWDALGGDLWGAFCPEVFKPISAIAVNGRDVYVSGRFVGFGRTIVKMARQKHRPPTTTKPRSSGSRVLGHSPSRTAPLAQFISAPAAPAAEVFCEKTSLPLSTVARMASPSWKEPLSISSASGSSRKRSTARRIGRAPYCGS